MASKQNLTHHFKVLREAGLVKARYEGRNKFVWLRRDIIDEMFPGLLDGLLSAVEASDRHWYLNLQHVHRHGREDVFPSGRLQGATKRSGGPLAPGTSALFSMDGKGERPVRGNVSRPGP